MASWLEQWQKDKKKRDEGTVQDKKTNKVNFKEASRASRIQTTLPNYQGQSKDDSYKWETDLLKPLSIKRYGRSYADKYSNWAKSQGLSKSQADELRRQFDFEEDRKLKYTPKKDGSFNSRQHLRPGAGAMLQSEQIGGILNDANNKQKQMAANIKTNSLEKSQTQKAKQQQYEEKIKELSGGKPKNNTSLLDDLKAVGKSAYQAFNPFDSVSTEEAVKSFLNRNTSNAFDEVARGANRAVDSASLGVMNNLDKKINDRNPYYLSQRDFGQGGGTDMLTTGLGYLVPGVGAYKALNATKAGKALTEFGSKNISKRLLSEAAKGATIGGGLSGAEVAGREALNPNDYNWKDNAQYIGLNTAIGGAADPLIYGLGKGVAKGLETASNRAMQGMTVDTKEAANRLSTLLKQYNQEQAPLPGKPDARKAAQLMPDATDITSPNYMRPLQTVQPPNVNIPQTGVTLDEAISNPNKVTLNRNQGPAPKVKPSKTEYQKEFEDAVQQQYDYLKNSMGKGVQYGTTGQGLGNFREVNGSYRISNNPKWYQDFYKAAGRKPTNAELKDLAVKHVKEGFDDEVGHIPPWQPKQVQEIDQEIENVSNMIRQAPEQEEILKPILDGLQEDRKTIIKDYGLTQPKEQAKPQPKPANSQSAPKTKEDMDRKINEFFGGSAPSKEKVKEAWKKKLAETGFTADEAIQAIKDEPGREMEVEALQELAGKKNNILDGLQNLTQPKPNKNGMLLSLKEDMGMPDYKPQPEPIKPKATKENTSAPVKLKTIQTKKEVSKMSKGELETVYKHLKQQRDSLSKSKRKSNKQKVKDLEEDIAQVEDLLMKLDLQAFGKNADKAPAKSMPSDYNAVDHIGDLINHEPNQKAKLPLKEKVKKVLDQTYIKMVDDFYGGTKLDKAAGKSVDSSESATLNAHMARGAGEKARQELERGYFDETGKKVGKSFNEIIQSSKNPDMLEKYLVARSVLDYDEKGMTAIKTDGMNQRKIAEKAIKDIETQFPDIKDEAKDMYQFIKNQRSVLVEGGMLNGAQVKAMDKANANYVPMERVHDDGIESFVNANEQLKKRYANVGNPIKKRTGSERDVISPLQTLVKRQYIYNNMAERNKVGKAILDNLETLGKDNPFAAVVDVEKNGAYKLVDAAGELASKTEKELPETLNDLFQDPDGKNNIVYVYKGGDKYKLQIKDKMLYESMMSLNVKQLPGWMKVINYPTQMLRAGVTLSPDFGLRNLFRDQLTTAVTSKVNYKPFYDALKGASEIIKARKGKSPIVESYIRNGGSMSVLQNIDRTNIVKDYQDLLGDKTTRQKLVEIAKDPLKWLEPLRKMGEFSEMATRVGHYKKALKKGMNPKEATYLARSTMDFNRAGTWGRQINQGVAFFNASVQGVDVLARSMKDRPVQTLKNIGLYVALPTAALYMMNKDKDWYKELPADARDRNWYIPVGDQILQLPKPFEIGILFGAGLERALDKGLNENANNSYKGFAKEVSKAMTPDVIPTAVKPLIEVVTNHNFFTGQSIETMGDSFLNPADRHNAYNSQIAIGTAKLLEQLNPKSPVSPKQIDHLIRGYSGTLGTYATEGIDRIMEQLNPNVPKKPSRGIQTAPFVRSFFVKNLEGNNRSTNDFYDLFNEFRNMKKTDENNGKEFPYVEEKKAVEKIMRDVNDLQKEKKSVLNSSSISAKDKAEQIKELNKQITELAKQGNAYKVK